MIEFNRLMLMPDNKGLYIDCSIIDSPSTKEAYIDKIIIDTQDTFYTEGEVKTPLYSMPVTGNVKSVQVLIDSSYLSINSIYDNMLFVRIVSKGGTTEENYTLGVCVNSFAIYNKALKYLKEMCNTCTTPKKFIDFILKYKAFQMCLKTRDFPLAISYWKKFKKEFNDGEKCICGCTG